MKYIICSVILFATVSAHQQIEDLSINLKDLVPVTARINVTNSLKQREQNARISQTLRHGVIAVNGMLPYQAIYIDKKSFFCSGAIISSKWFVTAAHCVYRYSLEALVIAGINNLNDVSTLQFSAVKNVTIYEYFNSTSYEHDLALIELTEPLKLNTWVESIPLADNNTELLVGNWVRTSGYNGLQGIQESNFLHYLDFNLIERNVCKETFGEYLQTNNICAVPGTDYNTCVVDYGSPLVDMKTGKLIGIATFSTGNGCDNQLPVAYTRISPYLDWINKKINTSA